MLVRPLEPGFRREVEHLCYLNNCVASLNGVSDGFRIERDPQCIQADQQLTDADRGKIEQEIRKSATSRNLNLTSQDRVTEPPPPDEEQTP